MALGMLFEEVGEEKHLQHSKDDKQLDEDDGPERFAQFHRPESIVIQIEDFLEKVVLCHHKLVCFLWQIYGFYLYIPNKIGIFFCYFD